MSDIWWGTYSTEYPRGEISGRFGTGPLTRVVESPPNLFEFFPFFKIFFTSVFVFWGPHALFSSFLRNFSRELSKSFSRVLKLIARAFEELLKSFDGDFEELQKSF